MAINRNWLNRKMENHLQCYPTSGLRTEVSLSTDSLGVFCLERQNCKPTDHLLFAQGVLANQFLWANNLFNLANTFFFFLSDNRLMSIFLEHHLRILTCLRMGLLSGFHLDSGFRQTPGSHCSSSCRLKLQHKALLLFKFLLDLSMCGILHSVDQ